MIIETERTISVTQLQKELTRRISEVSSDDKPLYVLKNNRMEAVILSADEYEKLTDMREMIECFEISDMISTRMKKYNRSKNITWEKLKAE